MDLIGDGKTCEAVCKYAPPENKWPCVDCDMRWHDRAEQITRQELAVQFPQKCACCDNMFQFQCRSDKCVYD